MHQSATAALYVCSAQKPTAVSHCGTGNLVSEDSTDLVQALGSFIHVHTLVDVTLQNPLSINIYGRVISLRVFKPTEGGPRSLIFCCAEKNQFCILAADNGALVERSRGDLTVLMGLPIEMPFASLDFKSRAMAWHTLAGLISIIPLDPRTGAAKEPFSVNVEELKILDICLLHTPSQKLCLALLHEVGRTKSRGVKTYWIDLRTREITEGPFAQPNVDPTANKLLAEPSGGLLVLGSATIVHIAQQPQGGAGSSTNRVVSIPVACGQIVAACQVDNGRFLLADEFNGLHVLALLQNGTQLTIDMLGETSRASSLCYLDDGILFVGSAFGDSQLVRLLPEPGPNNVSLEVLESFANLGPIVDMCMVDIDAQGRGQIVTCSGFARDGSLRVVRNGVGLDLQAEVELSGIKALFPLRPSSASVHHVALVQAFMGETRVLALEGEELAEVARSGLALAEPTLFVGNLSHDECVQVTPTQLLIMPVAHALSAAGGGRVKTFKAPSRFTLAASDGLELVAVAEGGGGLAIVDANAQLVCRTTLEHEVACLAVAGRFVVCGMWTDSSVRVLNHRAGLAPVDSVSIEGETLARSLVCSTLGLANKWHVFVGMGDGSLVLLPWDSDTGRFNGPLRKIGLGTLPLDLAVFSSPNGLPSVIAASDRPAVVYSSGDKVLLSNVNVQCEIKHAVPFHSQAFPGCLALSSDTKLLVGVINEIQKLHVKTVPLGEAPSRLAHQPSSGTLAVCTLMQAQGPLASDSLCDVSKVRLLDDRSFTTLDAYILDDFELAMCILSTTFFNEDDNCESRPFFVVGTSCSTEQEEEPSKGRILVFDVIKGEGDERKLNLVSERLVRGAVLSLCAFQGKLVAGINAKVQMYKWSGKHDGQGELVQACGSHGHTLSLMLGCHDNFIVVGDLMKSVSLLKYDEDKATLDKFARDHNNNWMTALHVLKESDVYLGAEINCNLFTLRRYTEADSEHEQARLMQTGGFHWGDYVNCFCAGSLVMPQANSEGGGSGDVIKAVPKLLFGTIGGAIGVLAALTWDDYLLLDRLQRAIMAAVPSRNAEWRAFVNNLKHEPASGFIDGDLIEGLLDMSEHQLEQIVDQMNLGLPVASTAKISTDEPARVTAAGVKNMVEELTRLH